MWDNYRLYLALDAHAKRRQHGCTVCRKQMKRWVERLPSFAEFKTVEKEKETVVSGDQELVTALKVGVCVCAREMPCC